MNDASCTPSNCPHAALLEKARAACLSCPRGGKPAGHGGTVSADAAGERIISRSAAYIERGPRGQVTNLAPATEEKTAELFRRWVGLDTIDALLALHLSNGGTCSNFGLYLQRTREAIVKYNPTRPSMRATAWSKWQALLRRIPVLAAVQSWSKGHGGAKHGQRKGCEKHFVDPAKEARRIENKAKLEAKKAKRLKILALWQAKRMAKAEARAERMAQQLHGKQQRTLEDIQRRNGEKVRRLIEAERLAETFGKAAQPTGEGRNDSPQSQQPTQPTTEGAL